MRSPGGEGKVERSERRKRGSLFDFAAMKPNRGGSMR
jgi:hypothetical protein